jgi:hypothetical protein
MQFEFWEVPTDQWPLRIGLSMERLDHFIRPLDRLPLLCDSQCAVILLTRVYIYIYIDSESGSERPSYLMRIVPYSLSFFEQQLGDS